MVTADLKEAEVETIRNSFKKCGIPEQKVESDGDGLDGVSFQWTCCGFRMSLHGRVICQFWYWSLQCFISDQSRFSKYIGVVWEHEEKDFSDNDGGDVEAYQISSIKPLNILGMLD